MLRVLILVLHCSVLIGGITVALFSDNPVVRWIGIVISVLSFISGLITNKDIKDIKKKSEDALYCGECFGEVMHDADDYVKTQSLIKS